MSYQPPAGDTVSVYWPWPWSRQTWGEGSILFSGAAVKATGGGVEQVVVTDVASHAVVGVVIPDAESGDWSLLVQPGSYMLTYMSDGCSPMTHGPYTVTE